MNQQLLNRSTSVTTQASPTNAKVNIPPTMGKIDLYGADPTHDDPHSTSNDSLFSSSDTSDKISKLLLSSPNTTASAKKVPSNTKLRRSSLSQQMHMRKVSSYSSSSQPPSEKYRRAAQSLGLLYRDKRNGVRNVTTTTTTTTTESEVPKSVLVTKDKKKQPTPKRRRNQVSFSGKVRVVVIERLSSAESKAMHTTNEEALELQKDAIHTAKTLRHLTKHYGHDVASLRAQAIHLQVDTCIRGIEHFLSRELFRERSLNQIRHADAVLDTQHRYRQYINAFQRAHAHASSPPTQHHIFAETMAGDIAKISKSLSRPTVLDAINRAVEDEEAARSL